MRSTRVAGILLTASALLGWCAPVAGAASQAASSKPITVVGAESQYANVLAQIGGRYVAVSAVEQNPNTDPHSFEASASVVRRVSAARLVVQNGLGYDAYMDKIEAATPSRTRAVIDVQHLLGLVDSTPNPHLWYKPSTMPAVAKSIGKDLSAIDPAQAHFFARQVQTFDASLAPWNNAIAALKARFPGAPVATTEPVGDYLLDAAGIKDETPYLLQADVMNGVDLPPQYVTLEDGLFTGHKVKVFLYNQQVVDEVTTSFLAVARRARIPVVGLYETMPTGYTYQRWMLAEVAALHAALAEHRSTERL